MTSEPFQWAEKDLVYCTSGQKSQITVIGCGSAETIHTDLCCVCFGTYDEDIETGREWLECCCGRWIHEECIDDVDVDNTINKVCPLC